MDHDTLRVANGKRNNIVIFLEVFEHAPNLDKAFKIISKLIKPSILVRFQSNNLFHASDLALA